MIVDKGITDENLIDNPAEGETIIVKGSVLTGFMLTALRWQEHVAGC